MHVRRIFRWDEDWEGGYGWLMQRATPFGGMETIPWFNASDETAMAHDAMEHFRPPRDNNSLENELMALGQLAFIRLETDRMGAWVVSGSTQHQTLVDLLASALIQETAQAGYNPVVVCPFAHRPSEKNEWLLDIIQGAGVDCLVSVEAQMSVRQYSLTDAKNAVLWLKHGYHMAHRRWMHNRITGHSWRLVQEQAAELFWQMVEGLRKNYTGEEDEVLSLSFDIQKFDYKIKRSGR